MALPKWTKKDLLEMDELGYWIIPCKDEQEAIDVKDICKKYGRCAQMIFFIFPNISIF